MSSSPSDPATAARLAGAPISWGVCEVPGWGLQLAPERVLAEMAALGLRATELGAAGWLPEDPREVRALLQAHDLELVGGFVPLVLHEASFEAAREAAETAARTMVQAGGGVFVAAVVMDDAWSAPQPLDDRAFAHLVAHLEEVAALVRAHGMTFALHPHAGTLVETAADVERVLAATTVGWCFDSGHLLIGGVDPGQFVREHADRIVHVHLKDVDAEVAARLRGGELSLMEATRQGLFKALGDGDAGIAEVLRLLDAAGYDGWLVLEQDCTLTQPPPPHDGPRLEVLRSLEFLAGARGHGG